MLGVLGVVWFGFRCLIAFLSVDFTFLPPRGFLGGDTFLFGEFAGLRSRPWISKRPLGVCPACFLLLELRVHYRSGHKSFGFDVGISRGEQPMKYSELAVVAQGLWTPFSCIHPVRFFALHPRNGAQAGTLSSI